MEFPKSVLAIVREVARKYDTIKKALPVGLRRIRKLPDYADLVDRLVEHSVRELIADMRHTDNRAMRKKAGTYGQAARVSVGQSPGVQRTEARLWSYRIAGTALGLVMGGDLAVIGENEAAKAEGHNFNVRLCQRLDPLVADDKRVQDAVSEKRLEAIFQEMEGPQGLALAGG